MNIVLSIYKSNELSNNKKNCSKYVSEKIITLLPHSIFDPFTSEHIILERLHRMKESFLLFTQIRFHLVAFLRARKIVLYFYPFFNCQTESSHDLGSWI